jgi:molybdopterin-containing oxidoreductase family iron-sulfur binding subunit
MPELRDGERAWFDRAMAELQAHAGHSLLILGPHLDPGWQVLAPAINDQLNNSGSTVWYSEPVVHPAEDSSSLPALAADIAAGDVDTLIVLDSNPAYTSPGSLDFAQLMARVPHRIHAGLYEDETARRCSWHLPLSHALESWSDARATDGTKSIIQPVIAPLYDSRTIHQFLEMLQGTAEPAADSSVRATWQASFGDNFAERWPRSLHDGFVSDSATKPVSIAVKAPPAPSQTRAGQRSKSHSVPIRRSGTAALPTSLGCRNCPSR